jgi:hypothetical protein
VLFCSPFCSYADPPSGNRAFGHVIAAATAGRPKALVRVRHPAHRTPVGKTHPTVVVAEQVADGFVIPLPYGTDVDR